MEEVSSRGGSAPQGEHRWDTAAGSGPGPEHPSAGSGLRPEHPSAGTSPLAWLLRTVRRRRGRPAGGGRPVRRWQRWRNRLAVTACLSWLGFVILHRLVSGRTYWWGPFDLLPPVVFVAMPLVLLVVALCTPPVRWRLTTAPAIALLLGAGCSGVNLATLWYDPPPPPPGAITVVSWNTMYWDQDLISGGERTTADFYRFLRRLDADVYLLHEYAHTDFSPADVFAQVQVIEQLPRLRETFRDYEIAIVGRNLTLSRLPIVESRGIDITPWLPDDLKEVPEPLREHPAFYNVQSLRTDIVVMGTTVSFYNTHLFQPPMRLLSLRGEPDRSVTEVDRFNRAMRRGALAAIRSDMAGNRHPIVLAGDLNTSPAMGSLGQLPDHLVDHTRTLSSIYPTSWSVGGPSDERSWSAAMWRLDWLFTTPEVGVHRYELLDPAGLSDHRVQQMLLSVSG